MNRFVYSLIFDEQRMQNEPQQCEPLLNLVPREMIFEYLTKQMEPVDWICYNVVQYCLSAKTSSIGEEIEAPAWMARNSRMVTTLIPMEEMP